MPGKKSFINKGKYFLNYVFTYLTSLNEISARLSHSTGHAKLLLLLELSHAFTVGPPNNLAIP